MNPVDNNVEQRSAAEPSRRGSSGRIHSASRERLLRMLEAQHAPASLTALTVATGLHENTVRGHLEALRRDGYVTRHAAPASGRGRPAWLWRAVQHDASTPYAPLASALAGAVVRGSDDPVATAREAGREWGRELVAARADDEARTSDHASRAEDAVRHAHQASARASVVDLMREQGFAPEPVGDGSTVLLRRCPLLEAAARHPEVVCAVHLGMADGALRALGDDSAVTLEPFTGPSECTLRLLAAR